MFSAQVKANTSPTFSQSQTWRQSWFLKNSMSPMLGLCAPPMGPRSQGLAARPTKSISLGQTCAFILLVWASFHNMGHVACFPHLYQLNNQ